MAKPGRIGRYQLLQPWQFETMGIARPHELPKRQRVGALAVKVGMTQEWNEHGARVPLTVLWIDECEVVQAKTPEKEGYAALQMGAGSKKRKQITGAEYGHFAARGVQIKRELSEFRVTPDAILPVGTVVDASHFLAGQYVDIQGKTIGKGFQGPMKRWGFAGLPASHGTTKKHRAHGSIGNSQDPGRVWKGKKMAGQMGNRTRTVQNCFVYRVDPERNLIYVVGQVPGKRGNFVRVKDALRKGDPTGCVPDGAPYPAWGFGAFEGRERPTAATTAVMQPPFPMQESSQEA